MLQLAGAAPAMRLFETEFDHSADQQTAMDTAWLIHNSMATEEAGAYLYWSYFWPDKNQLVYIDNPFNAPSSWTYPQTGYYINDYYYAVQHFSKYVQPGFQRMAALTGLAELRATAYFDQKAGRLVFVLVNTSAVDTLAPALTMPGWLPGANESSALEGTTADALSAAALRYGATAVYRSTFSGTDERFASLGPLAGNNVVTLPPQSVATVVIDNVAADCVTPFRGCSTSVGRGR
jgi:O-glycosyl hydrolase